MAIFWLPEKAENTKTAEKKPAKKGKELKVLDPKSAQNLCEYTAVCKPVTHQLQLFYI